MNRILCIEGLETRQLFAGDTIPVVVFDPGDDISSVIAQAQQENLQEITLRIPRADGTYISITLKIDLSQGEGEPEGEGEAPASGNNSTSSPQSQTGLFAPPIESKSTCSFGSAIGLNNNEPQILQPSTAALPSFSQPTINAAQLDLILGFAYPELIPTVSKVRLNEGFFEFSIRGFDPNTTKIQFGINGPAIDQIKITRTEEAFGISKFRVEIPDDLAKQADDTNTVVDIIVTDENFPNQSSKSETKFDVKEIRQELGVEESEPQADLETTQAMVNPFALLAFCAGLVQTCARDLYDKHKKITASNG